MGNRQSVPGKNAMQSKWQMQDDQKWTYGQERGPGSWWVNYPAAGGSHQSPIDIDPEEAEFDTDLAMYPMKALYPPTVHKLLWNTGHGCQVDTPKGECVITGGPMALERYVMAQFHFHWGERDDCGSEHTVNNKAYAGEIHFVHWNRQKFQSYAEAAESADGLVVFAVFMQLGSHSHAVEHITTRLPQIQYKDSCVRMDDTTPDLAAFFPLDMKKYWTYKGSLTTPPCHESVTWVVFYEPVSVSAHQLAQFRSLLSHTQNQPVPRDEFRGHILTNFRPVQPLGSRRVTTMEHVFTTAADFDEQFHKQGMFTGFSEISCQFQRAGLRPAHH